MNLIQFHPTQKNNVKLYHDDDSSFRKLIMISVNYHDFHADVNHFFTNDLKPTSETALTYADCGFAVYKPDHQFL